MPEFRHSDSIRLFDYWRSLSSSHPPDYKLWDPIAIPKLMPNILIQMRNEDGAFFFHFAGTSACEFAGVELTGRMQSEFLSPELRLSAKDNSDNMLRFPCAWLNTIVARSAQGRESLIEYLTLPLNGPDGVPDRLVVHMGVLETLGFGEASVEVASRVGGEWLDIGFGVPDTGTEPPLRAG